jgi:hypothetical protein
MLILIKPQSQQNKDHRAISDLESLQPFENDMITTFNSYFVKRKKDFKKNIWKSSRVEEHCLLG